MNRTCVICGTVNNLNTQMTISIDDKKMNVDLCDQHAEDTTVKMAREKYLEKINKINELIEQAKMLGLDASKMFTTDTTTGCVSQPNNSCKTDQAKIQTTTGVLEQESLTDHVDDKSPKVMRVGKQESEDQSGWISTDKFENVESRGFTSVGGQGAQSYSSYKVSGQSDILDEKLRQGKVKMGLAEGRDGSPLPVPVERIDGTGTTRIRIVKAENDQSLQKRFKGMASNQDHAPDFRHGYGDATRTCPICRGECTVNGKDCPKCKGSGFISVY